ncbi:hypothetical protein ABZU75_28835 [Streptosporangium sp. NPDC005286]|uniref:effector-associated constant component EACC1 n=1 Tax=Streptosporangium sp. NPDC005286 TaxID=3154463 RepID=UPI0033B4BE56
MLVVVRLSVEGENSADTVRDLYAWLSQEPELRGRVRIVEGDPEPGALGPVVEGLQMALGAGGAFASTATVLVAWLRSRRGEVSVKLSRGEGQPSMEVTAKGVKDLDVAAAKALTEQLTQVLTDAAAADTDGAQGS